MIKENALSMLEYTIVSLAFTISAIFLLSVYRPELWVYLLSVLFGYLISDYSLRVFIKGEDGGVNVPILGYLFQAKGITYIFYVIGIISATIIGSHIEKNYITLANLPESKFLISLFAGIIIFFDFQTRYYNRSISEALTDLIPS